MMQEDPQSAKFCILPHPLDKRPDTPEEIKKWRKCFEPGKRNPCHPSHESLRVSEKTVFGRNITESCDDHVEDLCKDRQEDEYQRVLTAQNESTYKKNPLGRSCNQGHKLPEFMLDSNYRHGVKTSESNEDAKSLIYPMGHRPTEDTESVQQSGQKRRNYKWPVDPATTIFGVKGESATSRGLSSGVKSALHMSDVDIETNKKKDDKITYDYTKVFGKSTRRGYENAAECLGHGSDDDVIEHHQDQDLGKSVTPGFRNVETKRIFGCPSVRTDIPKYERSSMADLQNYGEDVSAAYLLWPSLFASLGLEEDEFRKLRSKDYLKKLFTNCRVFSDSNVFDSIFCQVSDHNNCASIESILRVLRSTN
ncbi:hypothetical protein HJC23_009959 [Cyclotella cryptica]|uniref:EFHB C-terminal EF-hand domain-containing protein n=1 Tax=Cyclotella cryptica TaxID=29204 RepID=A0ABD3Q818_9STRA